MIDESHNRKIESKNKIKKINDELGWRERNTDERCETR